MTVTKARVRQLQKHANVQPAPDAALYWFLVWILVSCVLMWLFADRAFPAYDGMQGVALSWVGALISAGGLIAAVLCYLLYGYLSRRKQAAIDELKALASDLKNKG